MTTHTTTPTRQGKRDGGWLLAGMTAVTVTAIIAALLWQLRPDSETGAPGATATIATVNSGELDPAMFSDAELYARWQGAQTARLTPVYLVDTDEAAGALRRELEMMLEADGTPGALTGVVLAEGDSAALAGGMPVQVVDLRAASRDRTGGAGGGCGTTVGPTVC